MPALLHTKTTLISPDNLVTIGRDNTLKTTNKTKNNKHKPYTLMKLIQFYDSIEEIVNAAVKATEVEIDHLFFVPEKGSNNDGWVDAHRYGYDSKTGKCYDLGITDVMPKIDYTGFVFDFVPNGIHIAKRDKTTFKVDCSLYSSTEID